MSSTRRRRMILDDDVQRGLIKRVVYYWMLCAIAAGQLFLCWLLVPELPPYVARFVPFIFAFNILLLPIVFCDLVRLSHRFTGPMVQLRRAVRQLADGQPVQPVQLRKADYWQDFAADFNRALARVQKDGS